MLDVGILNFSSDCIHEVKPVTEGTRITITYLIETTTDKKYYWNDPAKQSKYWCGPEDKSANEANINAFVRLFDSKCYFYGTFQCGESVCECLILFLQYGHAKVVLYRACTLKRFISCSFFQKFRTP